MRKLILGTVFLGLLSAMPALAVDDDALGTTEAYESQAGDGYLRREAVSIKPQVGVIAYSDVLGQDTSRGAAGLAVDANVTNWFTSDPTNFYVGPSTGVIYSHLGSPDSNFIGTDSSTTFQSSANLLIIPGDVKVGYTFGDAFRLAVHGGGNVIYRSVASSMLLGDSSLESGSDWSIFPNAGIDVEMGLSENVALTLRPDVTFTSGDELFSGMLALGFTLG
jgi:hypothetical protein